MVADQRFKAPANAVESGILELASHIHCWYITMEATTANLVGLIGSDHEVVHDEQSVKSLHVDEIEATPPDRTTMVNDSLSTASKACNRSILKANSTSFHRSQPPARHVRWDPSTNGRTVDASCSKPVGLLCGKSSEHHDSSSNTISRNYLTLPRSSRVSP